MTSAEFAAKYRVLKNLTEHGARSQIAQEVALGRMVMVHHLDVGSAAERQRLFDSVGALDAVASTKVLEVVDIAGTKVIVTQFVATFVDFPAWLREHSTPGDEATLIMQPVVAAPAPPVAAPRAPARATPPTPRLPPSVRPMANPPVSRPSSPGFTALFGAGGAPPKSSAPSSALPSVPTVVPPPPPKRPSAVPLTRPAGLSSPPSARKSASFTEAFTALTPPVESRPKTPTPALPGEFTRQFQQLNPPAKPLSAAEPPNAGFTQVFGTASPPPATAPSRPPIGSSSLPPLAPQPLGAARFDSVMPPVQRSQTPAVSMPAQAAETSGSGFTDLFARLEASGPQVAAPFQPPPVAPPLPPMAAVPPAPMWQAPQPGPAAPPVPSMAPPVRPGAPPLADGPSEFTRILGRSPGAGASDVPSLPPMQLPPVQPAARPVGKAAQTPPVAPASVPAPAAPQRSWLPVIIAINVLVLAGLAVVVYFKWAK